MPKVLFVRETIEAPLQQHVSGETGETDESAGRDVAGLGFLGCAGRGGAPGGGAGAGG